MILAAKYGQRWVCGAERCRCGTNTTSLQVNLNSLNLDPFLSSHAEMWWAEGVQRASVVQVFSPVPKAGGRKQQKFGTWHAVNQGSVPRGDAREGEGRTGRFLKQGELGDFWRRDALCRNERISANKLSHT